MSQANAAARSGTPSALHRPTITRYLGSARVLQVHNELLTALQASAYEYNGELHFCSNVLYAGLFIEQLAYWHDRMEKDWIFNTRVAWAKQLFISEKDFRTAFEWLRAMGLVHSEIRQVRVWVEDRHAYHAQTICHYQLNFELLGELCSQEGVEVACAYSTRAIRPRAGQGAAGDAGGALTQGLEVTPADARLPLPAPDPLWPQGQPVYGAAIARGAIPSSLAESNLREKRVRNAREAAPDEKDSTPPGEPDTEVIPEAPGAAAPKPPEGFSPVHQLRPDVDSAQDAALDTFSGGAAAERDMVARMAATIGIGLRMTEPDFNKAYERYLNTMRERGRYLLPSQQNAQLTVFADAWATMGREDFLDVVDTMTTESKDTGYLKGAIRRAKAHKDAPPRPPGTRKPRPGTDAAAGAPKPNRAASTSEDIELTYI